MKLTPPFFRASLFFASLPVHGYLRRLLHDGVEVLARRPELKFRLAGLSYSFMANRLGGLHDGTVIH